MKRLCLLRHAKAVPTAVGQEDFDRTLNKRGRQAAAYMAGFMTRAAYTPDHALCSPAARTIETLAPLKERMPDLPVTYDRKLYHATWAAILSVIQETDKASATLLVIGHNPGLEDLALSLADDPDSHFVQDVARGLPTAGFVVLDFPVDDWKGVAGRGGHLVFFGRPRILMDAP